MKTALKIILSSLIGASLVAAPVFVSAQTSTLDSVEMSCISKAVMAREAALTEGYEVLASTTLIAYTERGAELKAAYGQSTPQTVRAAVKKAWVNFSDATKDSREDWRKVRNGAWKNFRTALVACGAENVLILDSANAVMEVSGL